MIHISEPIMIGIVKHLLSSEYKKNSMFSRISVTLSFNGFTILKPVTVARKKRALIYMMYRCLCRPFNSIENKRKFLMIT